MNAADVMSSSPDVVSGAVVFKGTRVPVDALFEYLSAGSTLDEFLDDFPTVQRHQAEAVVSLAGDSVKRSFGTRAA